MGVEEGSLPMVVVCSSKIQKLIEKIIPHSEIIHRIQKKHWVKLFCNLNQNIFRAGPPFHKIVLRPSLKKISGYAPDNQTKNNVEPAANLPWDSDLIVILQSILLLFS